MFRAIGGTQVLSNQFRTQRLSFLTFTAASNRAGSYVVHLTNAAGGPLLQPWTNAFLSLLADSDADGLPDVWELAHPTASDPASDSDNDGLTNLEEYRAGTNPTNAASVLKFDSIQRVSPAGDLLTLSFNAISNRSYTLQWRAALSSGSWSNLANILAQSSNRLVTVTNPLPRLPDSSYYRLVTPRQ